MGHANLEVDRDGIVRSVFLREGIGAPDRLHFAAALLEQQPAAGPLVLHGERHPDLAHAPAVLVRDYHLLIPFLGGPGHFTQLSYVDVLRGAIPAAAVRGKLVFVGATAAGIGDSYPTPRSGEGRDMAGVEIAANVAQALRGGTIIRPLARWPAAAAGWLPILCAGAALLLLPPTASLLLVVAIWIGTLGASILALRTGGWWWPPGAALVGLSMMYPLWSWRRLEASQGFLEAEFKLLAKERVPLLTPLPAPGRDLRPVDYLEQRIDLLRGATQQLRSVRGLFSDTLNTLPDATILADGSGRIVLANPAAAALFGVADYRALEDTAVDASLAPRTGLDELRFAQLAARAPCTIEAALDGGGRSVLVRAVPYGDSSGARLGTIIVVADITQLRAAQRERDDVLRFLSHDMKSPASSLLGLAQLQRDPHNALPPRELSLRLDLLAQRLLTLVDGFVALSRAESLDTRAFDEFDLRDALQDAYDEVWATAQARGVEMTATMPDDPLPVHGDRQLLARAIVNLAGNAVKFSPPGGRVTLALLRDGADGVIKVADQGPGIDPGSAASLFQRFSRGLHRGGADPGGAGLGLAFVRVAAAGHRGRAWAETGAVSGAVFCLSLPALPAAESAAQAPVEQHPVDEPGEYRTGDRRHPEQP